MDNIATTPATTSAQAVGDESQATGMDKAKGVALIALAAYGAFSLGKAAWNKFRKSKDASKDAASSDSSDE